MRQKLLGNTMNKKGNNDSNNKDLNFPLGQRNTFFCEITMEAGRDKKYRRKKKKKK